MVVVLAIVFSAFFSGMEIAFVTANKLKFELDKKQKKTFSGILSVFFDNPPQYIATMLVGNNIALVIYGIFTARILDPYFHNIFHNQWVILLLETVISTLIILVSAEFLPKTIFRIFPNFFLSIFSIPLILFYILLYPIAKFSVVISNFFLKVVSSKEEEIDTGVFRKVDIESLFLSEDEKDEQNKDDEINLKLFRNALDFSELKLRDCMLPRAEILAIEQGEEVEKLAQLFIESGFSRILIYKDNIDNVIGYANSLDIFKNPKSLKNITHRIPIVPESMAAEKLLTQLTGERKSMAVVVDEFGGTAGLITVEDIIEEIFGEIEDEFDRDTELEVRIKDNEFRFSARLEIDYLNEKYQLGIPESEEYETLAGYILNQYNNIPKLNQVIRIDNFEITIIDGNQTRIEAVHLRVDE